MSDRIFCAIAAAIALLVAVVFGAEYVYMFGWTAEVICMLVAVGLFASVMAICVAVQKHGGR